MTITSYWLTFDAAEEFVAHLEERGETELASDMDTIISDTRTDHRSEVVIATRYESALCEALRGTDVFYYTDTVEE